MLILPPWIALNQTLLQWSSAQIADATYMAMVQALKDLPESFTAYEMVYHVNDAFAPQVPRILESHWNDFKRHSSASAEPVMDVTWRDLREALVTAFNKHKQDPRNKKVDQSKLPFRLQKRSPDEETHTPFGAQAVEDAQHITDLEDSYLIDMIRLPHIEPHWKAADDASNAWFDIVLLIYELSSIYYAHDDQNERELEIDKAVFLREHPSWIQRTYRALMECRVSWERELRKVEDLIAEEGLPKELTDAHNKFQKTYGFIDPEITYLSIIRKSRRGRQTPPAELALQRQDSFGMSPKPLSYPNTVDVNPISNLLDTALPLGILTVQELLDYRTVARSTVKSTLAFLEKKKVKYAIFKAMRDSIADSTDPLFDTVKGLTERLLQELVVIESVLMDHIKLVNNIKLQYLFQTAEIQISKQKTYTHPTMSNEAVTKQVQIISNVVSKEFNQLKDLVLQSPPSFITEAQQKLLHMHVKRDTVESSLVETVLSPALKALKLKCREVFPLILV